MSEGVSDVKSDFFILFFGEIKVLFFEERNGGDWKGKGKNRVGRGGS